MLNNREVVLEQSAAEDVSPPKIQGYSCPVQFPFSKDIEISLWTEIYPETIFGVTDIFFLSDFCISQIYVFGIDTDYKTSASVFFISPWYAFGEKLLLFSPVESECR